MPPASTIFHFEKAFTSAKLYVSYPNEKSNPSVAFFKK